MVEQHFSMSLQVVWHQNGKVNPKNLLEYFLRWPNSMPHQLYSLIKLMLWVERGNKTKMNQTGSKINFT